LSSRQNAVCADTAARRQRKHKHPRPSKSADCRDKLSGGSVWHQQYDALAPQANELLQRAQVMCCESAFLAPPDSKFSPATGLNVAASAALVALMSILRWGKSRSDFNLQALLQWG